MISVLLLLCSASCAVISDIPCAVERVRAQVSAHDRPHAKEVESSFDKLTLRLFCISGCAAPDERASKGGEGYGEGKKGRARARGPTWVSVPPSPSPYVVQAMPYHAGFSGVPSLFRFAFVTLYRGLFFYFVFRCFVRSSLHSWSSGAGGSCF